MRRSPHFRWMVGTKRRAECFLVAPDWPIGVRRFTGEPPRRRLSPIGHIFPPSAQSAQRALSNRMRTNMQLFECQGCQSALHFENSQCLTCGRAVGFLQDKFAMSALEGGPSQFQALGADNQTYRYCDNAQHSVCNWLLPDSSPERLCDSCRHNRTIPDLAIAENVARWRKI